MKNVITYSLLVVCGILSLSANVTFAQSTPTVTTGRVAYPNETSEPLCGVVYLDETSVSLYGTVNPNGLATTVWFEYGTSSGSYNNTSSTQNVSGTTTQKVRIDISGLSLSTQTDNYYTYYYRIVGQNNAGISYGSEKRIVPIVPNFSSGVATYDATDITSDSVTLNGGTTTVVHGVWFDFDTVDGEYFYEVDAAESYYPNYSAHISGLSPATTYYYRIAGWDKLYIYYGEQKSFTTLEAAATPVTTPTPECEINFTEVLPKRLKLKRGQSSEVVVTLEGNNCVPAGKAVTATIGKNGNKRISISSTSEVTDENGEAKFTITAKNMVGNARVTFKADTLKKSLIVKVVR